MSGRTITLAIAFGLLVSVWVGLFAYTVVTRVIYDIQTRLVDASRRRTRRRIVSAARAGSEVDVDRLLGRIRISTLLRAATETSTSTPVARVFSKHLLRRAESRLRGLLVVRRHGRWQRVAALRVAALGELPDALTVLEGALRSTDEELQAAGVRILGELGTPGAQRLLIKTLRTGAFARSRVAAQLEDTALSLELLSPLLADEQPIVRYWGAKLLQYAGAGPGVTDALVAAATDEDANARAGAAASLAADASPRATDCLVALLDDTSPPVRLHAARSLGRRGTLGSADHVAQLLGDGDWWVRTAAKRALESLGDEVVDAIKPHLVQDDEFARNGAAEVLQNLGLVRTLVDRVATSPAGEDTSAARELAPILSAGGDRFASLALEHLDHDGSARVHSVVDGLS